MKFMELIHAKINRALVGPNICDFLIDWLIVMSDWFASLYDMHAIILYLCTNLVSNDSAQFVTKVRLVLDCVYWFICYHACLAFTLLIIVRYPYLISQLSYLFHLISRDSILGTWKGATVFTVPSR